MGKCFNTSLPIPLIWIAQFLPHWVSFCQAFTSPRIFVFEKKLSNIDAVMKILRMATRVGGLVCKKMKDINSFIASRKTKVNY